MTGRRLAVSLFIATSFAACDRASTPTTPGTAGAPSDGRLNITRFAGLVYDTAYRPLAGARVAFASGPRTGQFAIADANGNYLMNGPFYDGDTFRASHPGYVDDVQPLSSLLIPGGGSVRSFILESVDPPAAIAGKYTLTLTASPRCSERLPEALRTRTYQATITPDTVAGTPSGTALTVTLDGAPFFADYRSFWIFVAGKSLAISLEYEGYRPATIVEQVAAAEYLAIGGDAEASVEPGFSSIAATLNGTFETCTATSVGSTFTCAGTGVTPQATCTADDHRLALTRRD